MTICNDHIYIVPDKDEYKKWLLEYVLISDVPLWILSVQSKGVKGIVIKILKKIGLYEVVRKIIKR